MKNDHYINRLNTLLKCEGAQKKNKKTHQLDLEDLEDLDEGEQAVNSYDEESKSNKKYIDNTTCITKIYATKIKKLMEYESDNTIIRVDSNEEQEHELEKDADENLEEYKTQNQMFISEYQRKNKRNDIEYSQKNNFVISHKLCKVKGANTTEGYAGVFNEIFLEAYNTNGELTYVDQTEVEAFIKGKEEVDQLNMTHEETGNLEMGKWNHHATEQESSYSSYIQNNLYTHYVHDRHNNLIQSDWHRYNINADFSNYKNLPQVRVNEGHVVLDEGDEANDIFYPMSSVVPHRERVYNNRNGNFTKYPNHTIKQPFAISSKKKKNNNRNGDFQFPYNSKYNQKNMYGQNLKVCHYPNYGAWDECQKIIETGENGKYNDTINNAYIFEVRDYSPEDRKLIENSIKCHVKDLKNGTYVITFNIRKSGYYYFSIFINKQLVANSPYMVHIKPSIPHPANCIIYKMVHNKPITPNDRTRRDNRNRKRLSRKNISLGNSSFNKIFNKTKQKDVLKKLANEKLDGQKGKSVFFSSLCYGADWTTINYDGQMDENKGKWEKEEEEEEEEEEEKESETEELLEDIFASEEDSEDGSEDDSEDNSDDNSEDDSEIDLATVRETHNRRERKMKRGMNMIKIGDNGWKLQTQEDEASPPKFYLKCYSDKYDDDEETKTFSNFFIESYDAYNNKITDGKDHYEIKSLGSIKITEINNLNNGTYEVIYKYLKNESTYREIHITLNGCHVKGSPFLIILKSDKNKRLLKTLKNILPIENVSTLNPEQKLLQIMKSYQYIKENDLSEARNTKTRFISLHPYYDQKELLSILKKINKNIIDIMPFPMKDQLFHYIKYLKGDKKFVQLKKTLFKELLIANCKMLTCANSMNQQFQKNKKELVQNRKTCENTLEEITEMYDALKHKNIKNIPFTFIMKDMNLYEEELIHKKQELIDKQDQLVKKYEDIRKKELQFYADRKQITKELQHKYELHQAVYDASQEALEQKSSILKNITITNIKKNPIRPLKFPHI